jgi:hypothetical protein
MEMLQTVLILLMVFWLVGVVSAYTMGGMIHLLLVVAVVMLVEQVERGRVARLIALRRNTKELHP